MALTPTGKNIADPKKTPATGRSAEDDVIIREIDEAVRKDDTEQFFKKYGVILGGVLVVALLALGGYLLWDNNREGQLEEQSETLVAALDRAQAGDYAAASEGVSGLVDASEAGPRTSARFMQAAAALEANDTAKAVQIYGQIANDEGAPQPMRDLARIREIATNFDDRNPDDVIAKLGSLAQPGNAFFGSAGELVAIAYLEKGNRAKAGEIFGQIAKDEDAPESLRSRARQMAGLLGVDAIVDVDELLRAEGVDPEAGLVEQPSAPPAQ